VPGVIFASEALMRDMDAKVYEQVTNVAMLPALSRHPTRCPMRTGLWFSHRRVAAFDADKGAWCRRAGWFRYFLRRAHLHTGLTIEDIDKVKLKLATGCFTPSRRLGSTGGIRLNQDDMNAMLRGGARWRWSMALAWSLICSASRRAAACTAPIRRRFRTAKSASATRWARWAPAITILKCSR